MKFYIITNGYMGNGYVRAYVAAENDERAKEIASEVFRKNNDGRTIPYTPDYYEVSELEIVYCLDGTVEGAVQTSDD